jgi:hypothetical protein
MTTVTKLLSIVTLVASSAALLTAAGSVPFGKPEEAGFSTERLGRILTHTSGVALLASNHTGDLVNGQFGRPARGMGFGLGVQVVEDPVAADLRQSKGTFGWAGAYGTNINIDPLEKMVTIIMMQTSTPQLQRDFENAVMQAIID